MTGIDDPSKAEVIAAFLLSLGYSFRTVRAYLASEDSGRDTTDFWQTIAAQSGVNFPSRKARERVAEIMEATHA